MRFRKGLAQLLLLGAVYLSGCNRAPEPEEPEWTLTQETAAVLPDGESVGLWHTNSSTDDFYRLTDGTELLVVSDSNGPEETEGESLYTLSADAKRMIRFYYEEQGQLYDVQSELEAAYADYESCQSAGTAYEMRTVRQTVTPTAANERMICFLTAVQLPRGQEPMEEIRLSAVFDRETGYEIDLWSMFTVPQETVMERLLEAGEITDPLEYAELAATIMPERIFFYPDHMEIGFPQDALSEKENYDILIDYADLTDILHDWAIPEAG